jgi:hypothetical protein
VLEVWITVKDLRHEGSSKSLEEQSNRRSHRRDISTKTADERKQTRQERNGAEEQRNEVEREHEAREVVVLVRADELLRDALLGAKVPYRIKWQSWDDVSAVGVVAGRWVYAADGEEGPSRGVARVGDAVGGCLQEVESVQGRAIDSTGQDGEELE